MLQLAHYARSAAAKELRHDFHTLSSLAQIFQVRRL